MGAGDLKLMGAVGAILGFPQALGAMLLGSVAGGVQGVLALLARTGPGRRLCSALGLPGADQPSFARRVPLGVGLAVGVAAFRWWLTRAG
jgi:Flp pilus assembly protein protease CpaA